MKKLLISFSLLYLTAGIMHAQIKCPVEALGVKYDKSSPFGKEICTALTNLNSMADDLGNNFNGIVNKVQNEIEGFKKTNFPKDQISREAQVKFAIAKTKFKTIEDRIDRLIQDRQCGAPGVYKEMVRLFVNTGQTIKDIHAIGANSFTALKELQPIAARTGEIATELGNLATIVAGKSPAIDVKLTKLIKLVKGLQKDFEKVGDLDFINFTTSITALATNVGPFLLDCSTCAGTIGTSLGGMAAGGTETGGGTAASETGVGAVFIPVGAATTGISGVFGAIMATPACKGMADKSAQIDNYITDVTTFIKVTGELAENISTNTKSVVETSAALMELMQAIGEESKPAVKKIQIKLGLIASDMNKAVASFNQHVRPKIEKVSANTMREFSNNTRQLYQCYKQFSAVAALISQEVLDAAGNLVAAYAEMSGAKKLYDNMVEEVDKISRSIVKDVKDDWGNMNTQKEKFMKKILGNKPNDAGEAVKHLLGLATDFNSIKEVLDDLNKLAAKAAKFTEASVAAAFKALPSEREIAKVFAKMKIRYDKALEKIAVAESKMKLQKATAGL